MSRAGQITITKVFIDRIKADALPNLEPKAQRIVNAANAGTSAPVDIHYEMKEDHILLGPTNAADLPVEIGTRYLPARRYFKAAADAERGR